MSLRPTVHACQNALDNLERMFYNDSRRGRSARQDRRERAVREEGGGGMAQQDTIDDDAARARAHRSVDATLFYAGQRLVLRGRALRLILWVALHQQRINDFAPETGQLWLSWKGSGPGSLDGDLKVPLGPLAP